MRPQPIVIRAAGSKRTNVTQTDSHLPLAFDFDGGMVLLDEARDRLFVYGGDARLVWDQVAAGVSVAEIRAGVRAAAGDAAAAAIDMLIGHWREEGLLEAPTARAGADAAGSGQMPLDLPIAWASRVGPDVIGFRTNDDALADQLQRFLPRCAADAAEGTSELHVTVSRDGESLLVRDGATIVRTSDEGLLRGAIYHACLDVLHGFPAWRALIHGAAVALEGRAIGLPAPSGSGKTTLTAWLIAHGFDYLGDDLLAILSDGRVAQWPMPLSIKPGSLEVLADVQPMLGTLLPYRTKGMAASLLTASGTDWSRPPLPLDLLVFPAFAADGDAVPTPLRPLECLARLANDRMWIGHPLDRSTVLAFMDWLPTVPAYALRYRSLAAAERAIRGLAEDIGVRSPGRD
jgi:hypothetical protein